MNVPFVDLRAQHDELRDELEAAFRAALDDSGFIGGPRVASFEQAYARYCRVEHAISVASGTDALEFSLRAAGVGPGDIVVTVPNTFIATVEALHQLGAAPRFVEIDPVTYNMDTDLLAAYLRERCERDKAGILRDRVSGLRVAALLPVHLYGLPAEMNTIMALADEYALTVIEDACQAHGAEYLLAGGRRARAGTIGRAGCFSFYPGKNLGALGEAGAVVTNDRGLADQVRILRDHGQREKYVSVSPDGVNGRMDAIQAAMLEIKLSHLEDWNARRREAAGWYAEGLSGAGLQLPYEPEGARHVYHLYVVRVPERERVQAALTGKGIGTGLHYPVPLHRQPAFAGLDLGPVSFPETDRAAAEILSLPMYPHITRAQVAYVCASLNEALA